MRYVYVGVAIVFALLSFYVYTLRADIRAKRAEISTLAYENKELVATIESLQKYHNETIIELSNLTTKKESIAKAVNKQKEVILRSKNEKAIDDDIASSIGWINERLREQKRAN